MKINQINQINRIKKIRAIGTGILGATLFCTSAAFAQKDMMAPAAGTPAADKVFLTKASEGGMAEIAFSQIALKKSKNDDVKTYAQKMIDDHTMLMAKMKPFCDAMGVMPPAKLNKVHEIEAERLKSMSGEKFDKEYITAMVGDHHKDLGEFMTEKTTTTNADLKATVAEGTTVIMMHTTMIDGIAQKNGIATPPMPAMTGM